MLGSDGRFNWPDLLPISQTAAIKENYCVWLFGEGTIISITKIEQITNSETRLGLGICISRWDQSKECVIMNFSAMCIKK